MSVLTHRPALVLRRPRRSSLRFHFSFLPNVCRSSAFTDVILALPTDDDGYHGQPDGQPPHQSRVVVGPQIIDDVEHEHRACLPRPSLPRQIIVGRSASPYVEAAFGATAALDWVVHASLMRLPGEATKSIKSVGHAADLLFDKWPLGKPAVAAARAACLKAGVSPRDIVQAKAAFENAAREANIFVSPSSDGDERVSLPAARTQASGLPPSPGP